MLEIKKVNKYFNKGKKNELHVINNTTISFEDTGLVALLGPSGCGKTTLLNSIGGLDNIKSGSIYVNGKKISSKLTSKVDKIRNLNIGYIFQDYKLIDNMSVYDNVALVLTMVGIKDKAEIKKRVEYVLDKVGMLRYKKRPANMLSGGERQRVGIARALVKDPNIILADEPTGNLDSKNSLEIMKIIKAISKNRLVILVTHETSLAHFYASRIIEIKDGKITDDYINDKNEDLDYEIDNSFYLKDFKNVESIKKNNYDIDVYSNTDEKIKLDIVLKNGNIYIKSNTSNKLEIVDDNSSIEFVDEHYKKINKNDILKYDFDFKDIINNDYKKKYSSILNPITLIIKGFKKVLDFPFLKKILLVGFLISAMFIMYATSSIAATFTTTDKDFVTTNKNYLSINLDKIKKDDYLNYENNETINYLLPGNSIVKFIVKYDDFYQTSRNNVLLNSSLSSIKMINKDLLISGRMPENNKEVVVDKFTIEAMFERTNHSYMSGINNYTQMLNRNISIKNMDEFTIVGITDLNSPSVYVDDSQFINIIFNSEEDDYYYSDKDEGIIDYNLKESEITLKEGRMPVNDYETIVSINNKESMKLNKEINYSVGDVKLTVVGYYDSKEDYNYYMVNNNTIKYDLINNKQDITIYSNNKDKTIEEFRNMNLDINDTYEQSKDRYNVERTEKNKNTIFVSGIILIISLVEIYLMIRSSFLSRIKEIGIYRAIGVKKIDIYKMFMGEIIAITTLASVPGLIFMAYALNILQSVKYLKGMFVMNPFIFLIALIFIYLFNLLIGLIPVFNTIRKRPAQILARHDLD